MTYEERWSTIEEVGSGGQGRVYRVLDAKRFGTTEKFRKQFQYSLHRLSLEQPNPSTYDQDFEGFKKCVLQLVALQDPNQYCALKVLHKPEDARDYERAAERIKKEIEAMARVSHPNLLRVIDFDSENKWFVSPFFSRGTLSSQRRAFTGDFVNSIKAIRPLVAGVAELHKAGIVHRDIKPHNVFLDQNGGLVLGDFGLVFFTDDKHTRVSDSLENVGSRDWMPAWAMSMRIEEINPSFDVFSLGKLLWYMVSGLPFLRLWYFEKDMFNLEKLFPKAPFIQFANVLFAKCIVEDEVDCLKDANALLVEIDDLLQRIEFNADLIGPESAIRCKACGVGYYKIRADESNRTEIGSSFGFTTYSPVIYRIYTCTNCGNVQFFHLGFEHSPKFWLKE
jgi:serine/threonine protein kinase